MPHRRPEKKSGVMRNRSARVGVRDVVLPVIGRAGRKGEPMFLGHVTLAVILVAITGCGAGEDTPSEAEESAYSESAPPLGESVEFFLYTHCGVESLRLNGRWWHAVPPLYGEDGVGSSPERWGDPYEKGQLTLHSRQRATFEAEGTHVVFVPAEDNRPKRICR